ncbi:MAG: histidine kinase [Gammaproteobacteria bacterium]|nr:histidine kinase [Gammaproteobacteria bacterium]
MQDGASRWLASALVALAAALVLALVVGIGFEPDGPARGTVIALLVAGLALAVYALRAARNLTQGLRVARQWVAQLRAGDRALDPASQADVFLADMGRDLHAIAMQLDDWDRRVITDVEHERLAQKTRSLELLYNIDASVNVARDLDELLVRSLHALKEMTGAEAASMRLVEEDGSTRLIASLGTDEDVVELKQRYAAHPYTIDTGEGGGLTEVTFFKQLDMISVPLPFRGRTHGVIDLYVDDAGAREGEEIRDFLTSIGRHLGMAIERHGLDGERERLSRMEERTRLAYELHDSLAQTLASLRFQVRVLDETLHEGDEAGVWQELERVESSLDEAYAELRALIAQFRRPVHEVGLVPSIGEIVNRFREETGVTTFFQNECGSTELPLEIESQVVRIVQEALTNARKHSQAQNVRVMLRNVDTGEYRVLVEDDGVGFAEQSVDDEPGEHIGLHIMTERAQRIGGQLRIESEPGEGTRVLLTFQHPLSEGVGEQTPAIHRAV